MSVTEEIKARLDIVNFLSQYMNLKKAGRNYTGLCPFHAEKTPSFVVFPESQNWRCFGACGEGGDIFNFLMKREGLDFASALRTLADKAGVQLQERTPEQSKRDEQLDRMRGLLEETARFFHDRLLKGQDAEHARAYARKRGLSGKTLAEFKIGYAPGDWRQALDHLKSLGYDEKEIVEAGVATHNEEKDSVYDRFRNRLIIPICDGRGQVIAFGGRVLSSDDNPKYLNSPQTALFDKGSTLFALHLARRTIRENETAVIVEGYMDAIQAHQGGFSNVVAQMGTALTEAQLRQLSKYARRLILALDPDAAGVQATLRGVEVARKTLGDSSVVFDPRGMLRQAGKLDVEILIMTLPDGQDPDDLIRDNPHGWGQLVENAEPVVDYVIAAGTADITTRSTFTDCEQVARDLLPILLATENDLQQHYNIQRLALRLRLDERTLIQWAQQQRGQSGRIILKDQQKDQRQPFTAPGAAASPAAVADGQTGADAQRAGGKESTRPGLALERYCLGMLIQQPRLWALSNRRLRELAGEIGTTQEVLSPLVPEDFSESDHRMIFEALQAALEQDEIEYMAYLEQHLPYDLFNEVERLTGEVELMRVYRDKHLPRAMEHDLDAVIFEVEKTHSLMANLQSEQPQMLLEHKVLELRRRRLARENQDIQFLQQEAEPGAAEAYDRQVSRNKLAIRYIDNVLRSSSSSSTGASSSSKLGVKGGATRRG